MKNITEVRTELAKVFEELKSGQIKSADAKELNNCAGKIINSLKVELEYATLRKVAPEIKFLDSE